MLVRTGEMVAHAPAFRYGRAEDAPASRSPSPQRAVRTILRAMTDDTEIELKAGPWSAVVSSHGASLRGASYEGVPVVTGYHGAANKQGGQGDVLIPFPGRVAGGRYRWDGVDRSNGFEKRYFGRACEPRRVARGELSLGHG